MFFILIHPVVIFFAVFGDIALQSTYVIFFLSFKIFELIASACLRADSGGRIDKIKSDALITLSIVFKSSMPAAKASFFQQRSSSSHIIFFMMIFFFSFSYFIKYNYTMYVTIMFF